MSTHTHIHTTPATHLSSTMRMRRVGRSRPDDATDRAVMTICPMPPMSATAMDDRWKCVLRRADTDWPRNSIPRDWDWGLCVDREVE